MVDEKVGEISIEGTGYVPSENDGYSKAGHGGGAVSTNGSHLGTRTITINSGSLSGSNCGIYLPTGTLNVNGGSISGSSGIVTRGGTLNVNGGTITATGSPDEQYGTGDATLNGVKYTVPAAGIVIDQHSSYNSGNVTVKITAGTVKAENQAAAAIGHTVYGQVPSDGNTISGATANIIVTGGTFSDFSALAYQTSGKVTVKLEKDVTLSETVYVKGDVDLDLGGNTLKSTAVDAVRISSGTLTVRNGSLINPTTPAGGASAIWITGGSAKVVIEEDATISANYCIGANSSAGGASIEVYGKIVMDKGFTDEDGDHGSGGVYISGNIKETPVNVTIGETADIDIYGTGLYIAGLANVVTEGTIKGVNSAIEIRAGSLKVKGGSLTATATPLSDHENGNGTTTTGAAIAVAQHTTKLPIEVTIEGGVISGYTALSVADPEGNGIGEGVGKVTVSIKDGTFEATNSGPKAITVEEGYVKPEIAGGAYSDKSAEPYVPADQTLVEDGGYYRLSAKSKVVEGLNVAVNEILGEDSGGSAGITYDNVADVVDAIQGVAAKEDTDLKTILEGALDKDATTDGDAATMEKLKDLDTAVQEAENENGEKKITVSKSSKHSDLKVESIGITNAALNADLSSGETGTATVTLEVDSVETPRSVDSQYSKNVQFSMELKGDVKKGEDDKLAVPVVITLPIPDGFDPNQAILVLHYHGNGDPDPIEPFNDGEKVTFVVDNFSDFVLVGQQLTSEPSTPGNTGGNTNNGGGSTSYDDGDDDDYTPSAPVEQQPTPSVPDEPVPPAPVEEEPVPPAPVEDEPVPPAPVVPDAPVPPAPVEDAPEAGEPAANAPETDVPDADVPLASGSGEERAPEVEIPDEDVPLSSGMTSEPATTSSNSTVLWICVAVGGCAVLGVGAWMILRKRTHN